MDLSAKSLDELKQSEQEAISRFDAADEADDLDAMQAAAGEIEDIRNAIKAAGGTPEDEADTDEDDEDDKPLAASAESADAGDLAGEAAENAEVVTSETEPEPEPETEPEPEPEADEPETNPEGVEPEGQENPSGEEPDVNPELPEGTEPEEDQTDAPAEVNNTHGEENTVDIPEDRQPEAATESASVANTIVAGAQLQSISVGDEFTSRSQLNEEFAKRINALRAVRGGGNDRHTLATIVASGISEDRILDPSNVEANRAKIAKVVDPVALTASGGYCAPLETRYDIFGIGVTSRPVRDALAGFQATRGGIRTTEAPKIADYGDSLGIWTNEVDSDPFDSSGEGDPVALTKPCLKVECAPEVEAELDAITLCLEFGNLMTRAYPELVDAHNQLALVAHARFAENFLLGKISDLSLKTTSAFRLGTARDFLAAASRAAVAYRWRYRMNPTDTLRAIAPYWVRDAMRLDLALQVPGDDSLAEADRQIDAFFSTLNVAVSWHLDGPGFPAEVGGTSLDDFPSSFKWHMYAEGSLLHLDGGTLDLGIIRDSELVGTNDYKTFTETFEGVAKIGGDVIEITTTTHAAGGTVGTVAVV